MVGIDFTKPPDESKVYPATHHFKAICDAAAINEDALAAAAVGFDVRAPFARGNTSSGGKYVTYEISVHFTSRAEHHRFHEGLKAVVGVKILL